MKGDTIDVCKKGTYFYLTFFNAFVNTDTLDEGCFTIYTITHHNGKEYEDEYIYTTDEWYFRVC